MKNAKVLTACLASVIVILCVIAASVALRLNQKQMADAFGLAASFALGVIMATMLLNQ